MQISMKNLRGGAVEEAVTLYDQDLNAANTREHPDRIKPVPLESLHADSHELRVNLPPASWTVIRVAESR